MFNNIQYVNNRYYCNNNNKENRDDNYIHSHSKTKLYTAINMHQLFYEEYKGHIMEILCIYI